jgi:hypothetical protein
MSIVRGRATIKLTPWLDILRNRGSTEMNIRLPQPEKEDQEQM